MTLRLRHGVVLVALIVTVLTTSLSAASAGGSSSKSSSDKQWANSVCGAFQDFGQSVQSTLDGLKSADSLDAAAQQAEQGIESAAKDLQSSLDDLGKPPSSGAKQAQSAVQNLSKQLSNDVDDVKSLLSPPPSTPQEIASTFSQIGSIIQKGVSQTQSTANTLEGIKSDPQLKNAFQSASNCKQLKKSL